METATTNPEQQAETFAHGKINLGLNIFQLILGLINGAYAFILAITISLATTNPDYNIPQESALIILIAAVAMIAAQITLIILCAKKSSLTTNHMLFYILNGAVIAAAAAMTYIAFLLTSINTTMVYIEMAVCLVFILLAILQMVLNIKHHKKNIQLFHS